MLQNLTLKTRKGKPNLAVDTTTHSYNADKITTIFTTMKNENNEDTEIKDNVMKKGKKRKNSLQKFLTNHKLFNSTSTSSSSSVASPLATATASSSTSFSDKITPIATYSETSAEGYLSQQLSATRTYSSDNTKTIKERYNFPTPTMSYSSRNGKEKETQHDTLGASGTLIKTGNSDQDEKIDPGKYILTTTAPSEPKKNKNNNNNNSNSNNNSSNINNNSDRKRKTILNKEDKSILKSDIANGVTVSSAFLDLTGSTDNKKAKQSSFISKFIRFCLCMMPMIIFVSKPSVITTIGLKDIVSMPLNTFSSFSEGFLPRGKSDSESFALRYKDSNLILSSKGQTLPLLVMTAERALEKDGYYFLSVKGEDDKCIMQSKKRFSFKRPTLKVNSNCRQETNKKNIEKKLWKLENSILENYNGMCLTYDGKLSRKRNCATVEMVLINDPRTTCSSFSEL